MQEYFVCVCVYYCIKCCHNVSTIFLCYMGMNRHEELPAFSVLDSNELFLCASMLRDWTIRYEFADLKQRLDWNTPSVMCTLL